VKNALLAHIMTHDFTHDFTHDTRLLTHDTRHTTYRDTRKIQLSVDSDALKLTPYLQPYISKTY
jgi:hypothetical protein